jgi:hypothetical protein
MVRGRLMVQVSALVVGLGGFVALGASYLAPGRAGVGPLPAEALVLPGDARFVFGLDVKRFVASEFYRRYATRGGAARPDSFRQIEERTGLVPERDLEQVFGAGTSGAEVVAVALGHFDQARLVRALEQDRRPDLSSRTVAGTKLFVFRATESKPDAVAFLDDRTILLGSAAATEARLLVRGQGAPSIRDQANLSSLLLRVTPGSTFWMVGEPSAALERVSGSGAGQNASNLAMMLPGLKQVVVTGDVDPALTLSVTADAADETAARSLADTVNGLLAIASLQAAQKPELRELQKAVRVTAQGSSVLLAAHLPYALLDLLQPRPAPSPGPPAMR